MKIIRPITIVDGTFTSSSVPETDYAAYNVGTTYAIGNRVIVVATHQVYESVVSGNLGNAVTDVTKWLNIGYTNKWRMFDTKIGTTTSQANSVVVVITPTTIVDSIGFFNISADNIRIKVTDTVDGVIYDKTTSLVSSSGIDDWFPYFFEPIVRRNDLVVFDMYQYAGAAIEITFTDTGNTVTIGTCQLGQQRWIGEAQWGSSIGIIDYSLKTVDAFGNIVVVPRSYSKRGNFQIYMNTTTISEIQKIFAQNRSIPITWSADDDIEALSMLGYYKDFEINVAYPTVSTCTLTVEGLSQ